MNRMESRAQVGVIMGSISDHSVLGEACMILSRFRVPFEAEVVSAHRTPRRLFGYASTASARGLKVIIAGAGGAAHLPGMVASMTSLPVIGVPICTSALSGLDSLYSIVQMPGGVPVATVGIDGGKNAGLLAVRILATADPALMADLDEYRESLVALVTDMNEELKSRTPSEL